MVIVRQLLGSNHQAARPVWSFEEQCFDKCITVLSRKITVEQQQLLSCEDGKQFVDVLVSCEVFH